MDQHRHSGMLLAGIQAHATVALPCVAGFPPTACWNDDQRTLGKADVEGLFLGSPQWLSIRATLLSFGLTTLVGWVEAHLRAVTHRRPWDGGLRRKKTRLHPPYRRWNGPKRYFPPPRLPVRSRVLALSRNPDRHHAKEMLSSAS